MPFIQSAVAEAAEAEAVPEGKYDLRIHSNKERINQEKGSTSIECMILIEHPDFPNAAPVNFYLPIVGEGDEPKVKSFKLLQQKRFLTAFSIPFDDTGFDTDDFNGATAHLSVVQSEVKPNDPTKQPYVRNDLVLPRLAAEEHGQQQPTRRGRR